MTSAVYLEALKFAIYSLYKKILKIFFGRIYLLAKKSNDIFMISNAYEIDKLSL